MLPLLLGAMLLALPTSADAAEPETGTITGTVTPGSGPLAGEVEVCAKSVANESVFKCTWAAVDGSYAIVEVPAGEYKVGFWPTGNYVTQFWREGFTWSEATAVPVVAGQTTPDIDAVLEAGATISGAVTAATTGAPVEKVEACARLDEPLRELELERCAKTDAKGEYTIDGLTGGRWSLYFYAQDAEADVVSAPYAAQPTLEVGPQQNLQSVSQALIAGGQIAGTVRLAGTGAPVGGVQVCVTTSTSPTPLGCLRTPSSGAYRFLRVWPGSYKVVFSPEPSGTEGPNSYPTQWWGGQSTFDSGASILVTPPAIVNNIDASLVGQPTTAPAAPGAAAPVAAKPVLRCRRGFVKRKVHGRQRCAKRHNAKSKPRHKHHKPKHRVANPRSRRS